MDWFQYETSERTPLGLGSRFNAFSIYIKSKIKNPFACGPFTASVSINTATLLAFVDKYGVSISQFIWLCQALLEVSMNKIALWINVCADDWTAEMSTIANNVMLRILFSLKTMESLQIGVTTQLWVALLFSMRAVSLASLQTCRSVYADTWCKRALAEE